MNKIMRDIGYAVMLILAMSVNGLYAYDCILDTNGDGVANGTAGASSSSSTTRLACGNGAVAGQPSSTAVGRSASANGESSTALGRSASAGADGSTAIGRDASASGMNSIAIGINASAEESLGFGNTLALGESASAVGFSSMAIGRLAKTSNTGATALGTGSSAEGIDSVSIGVTATASGFQSNSFGRSAKAASMGALSLGTFAGFSNIPNTDSPASIAIGYAANIKPASPGAIAIGGDSSDDLLGAEANGAAAIAIGYEAKATQPGAIAIGANVVADIADTMVVGVPVHIKRDDGSSNILVEETNATVAVRTLGELANNGGVRLRFNNMALGEEWDFTSNQTGGFQFSLVGSGGAELSVGTNGTVRMGPGPISNLTLFPSGNMTIEGVLTENSDRNSKQQITELDHESILDKVSALSIHEWEYKDSPDQRHIGPMAQDFHQAFNLGKDNKHIATLDMAGVALASIQALKQENETLKAELKEMKVQLSEVMDLKELLVNYSQQDNALM